MSAVANIMNAAMKELIPISGSEPLNVFKQKTVLFSKLYGKKKTFTGGYSDQGMIRELIEYKPLPGGPHVKGTTFINENVDNVQPVFFDIKFMAVTIVLNKIDIQVINRGEKQKIFDIAKQKLNSGMNSLGLYADIGSHLPGTGASYSAGLNGLTEICNDGTATPSIGGAAFTEYGKLSRANADYGFAVRGKTLNLNGSLTHRVLLDTLKEADPDGESSSFGYTTPKTVVYIEDRFQPQQRFSGQTETDIGIAGWKFHNKVVFESNYMPGAKVSGATAASGEYRVAYEYIKQTSRESGTELAAYPTVTGETFNWVNTNPRYMALWVSDNPTFNFGFDDFQGNPNNDEIVGRFRLACNITCMDNRRQYEINQIKV